MSCACKDEEAYQGVLCMPAGKKRLIVQSREKKKGSPCFLPYGESHQAVEEHCWHIPLWEAGEGAEMKGTTLELPLWFDKLMSSLKDTRGTAGL